jgi:hypothetical protein
LPHNHVTVKGRFDMYDHDREKNGIEREGIEDEMSVGDAVDAEMGVGASATADASFGSDPPIIIQGGGEGGGQN